MMRSPVLSLLILGLWFSSAIVFAALTAAASVPSPDAKASSFTLIDQYGTCAQSEYLHDKITILVFADQWLAHKLTVGCVRSTNAIETRCRFTGSRSFLWFQDPSNQL